MVVTGLSQMEIKAVDLFCGAGGLAFGLKSAGLHVSVGVDLDPRCKYPLEANTGGNFHCMDVASVTNEHLEQWFHGATVRVLAGCAPCQPFSTYAQSRKTIDDRWKLLREFQRLAISAKPEIVTMENVVGLSTQKVWRDFVMALKRAGYWVSWLKLDCKDIGVPQHRKRLVLLASSRGPITFAFPEKVSEVNVRDAIGKLPKISAGAVTGKDPMHVSSNLTQINVKRIKASKPGGTWRDWPKKLRAECHKRESGKTYPSVYGRMEWDKPAPTVTTQCYGYGNGRFGHPEQDRAISLREAAILQSFPNDYRFIEIDEKPTFVGLGTLIGNAVPPKLGEFIGKSIVSHLNGDIAFDGGSNGQLPLI